MAWAELGWQAAHAQPCSPVAAWTASSITRPSPRHWIVMDAPPRAGGGAAGSATATMPTSTVLPPAAPPATGDPEEDEEERQEYTTEYYNEVYRRCPCSQSPVVNTRGRP